MTINNLSIENYQSHKKTELEFSDGINIICGDSDSGKSAILRALNWVVFNKPAGDTFKSWWCEDTQVTVLQNNNEISRFKYADKVNAYSLFLRDEKFDEFKAFGQGVPEEIEHTLNLSSINFQSQHNPHFLLSQSAGEVSRYLNGIVNLDVIDTALSNANRKIKSNNAELLNQEQLAEQYQTELESYSWIEEKEKEIKKLEKLKTKGDSIGSKVSIIKDRLNEIQIRKWAIAECEEELKHEKQINVLLEISKRIQSTETKADVLDNILDNIDRVNFNLKQAKVKLKNEKQIECLLKLSEKVNSKENECVNLNDLNGRIILNNIEIKEMRDKIKSKEQDFKKAFPTSCPLCGK